MQPPQIALLHLLAIVSVLVAAAHRAHASRNEFKFTSAHYNVTIPENSIGEVYARPEVTRDFANVAYGSEWRMGIVLHPSRKSQTQLAINRVEFRVVKATRAAVAASDSNSDDFSSYFVAEKQQIRDFCFLRIRTRANNNAVFNRERRDRYEIVVEAYGYRRKKHKGYLHAQTKVTVRVTDMNDLSPFFVQSEYRKTVSESLPVHSSVVQVAADDADLGLNGEIYYRLANHAEGVSLQQQRRLPFAVHPTTGIVSLIRPLSYRHQSFYKFKVLAEDRTSRLRQKKTAATGAGSGITAAECTIEIRVKQANLFAPQIHVEHLPQIVEHSNVDIYGIVTVTDADTLDPESHSRQRPHHVRNHHSHNHQLVLDQQQQLRLDIVDGDPDGYFRLRRTRRPNEFNVEVYKLLDRERTPYGYNLTLEANDNGLPVARTSRRTVHVRLIDLNDNSPVFDRAIYEVNVSEIAPINTLVTRIKVADYDLGRNAEVSLELIGGGNELNTFRLNSRTGVLYTNAPLDFETRKFYSLTVTARDHANFGQRMQSSAKILVSVTDANDNRPVFRKPFVGTGSATTAVVFVAENEPAGTFVCTVAASDDDSAENAIVSYSIANFDSDSVPFTIHSLSGDIKTTKLLDYETQKREYQLKIRASDWGYPYRWETERILNVKVRDVNDNRPQFEKIDCTATVRVSRARKAVAARTAAETEIGKLLRTKKLFRFSAIDFDHDSEVSYRIVSGNEDNCFYLDQTSGWLSGMCEFARKFDLQSFERELNVTATDGTHFSDVNRVRIRVRSIAAAAAADDDDDGGENSIANNVVGLPRIDWACTETNIREKFDNLIRMSMESNQNFATATVNDTINYLDSRVEDAADENLASPEFRRFPNSIEVSESLALNTAFLQIEAFDTDRGYAGKLTYVIAGGDLDSVFDIDTETGLMKTVGYLDREKRDRYLLNISVSDLASRPKSTWRLLRIQITDVNDNRPRILDPIRTVRLRENVQFDLRGGLPVTRITATDADSGRNAEIAYVFENPAADNRNFELDRKTGDLRLVREPLDREKQPFYELHIRAVDNNGKEDGPELPLYAEAIVHVVVDDENDNRPEFDLATPSDSTGSGGYETNVFEDVPIGTVVLAVSAHDADSDPANTRIRYAFKPSFASELSNPFRIDARTGLIQTRARLDYERTQTYRLAVVAYNPVTDDSDDDDDDGESDDGANFDAAVHRMYSEASVRVHVVDVNENFERPTFRNDADGDQSIAIAAFVREHQPANAFVVQLNATDSDADFDDSRVSYSIENGDGFGLFSIDPFGIIRTTTSLDYETKSHYWLNVFASDNAIIPLYSSISVSIEIVRDSETALAEKPIYFAKISESVTETAPGVVDVLKVNMAVADAVSNRAGRHSPFAYRIVSANPKGFFSIANDGTIRTTGKPLDRESQKEHELEIEIYDKTATSGSGANVTATASTKTFVLIEIEDVNDNSPKFLQSIYRIRIPAMVAVENSREKREIVADTRQLDSVASTSAATAAAAAENDVDESITERPDDDDDADNLNEDDETLLEIYQNASFTSSPSNEPMLPSSTSSALSPSLPSFGKSPFDRDDDNNYNFMNDFLVLRVAAIDADTGRNAEITYSLLTSSSMIDGHYRIDNATGKIFLKNGLVNLAAFFANTTKSSIKHELTVIATDSGEPSLNSSCQVIVEIVNVIDSANRAGKANSPPIAKNIEIHISENENPGYLIAVMQATDPDNDMLLYDIIDGDSNNQFYIDRESGAIFLVKYLDCEQQSQYLLNVSVSDIRDTVFVELIFNVIDVNDNRPQFEQLMYELEIAENLTSGSTVFQLNATDADRDNKLFYSIYFAKTPSITLQNFRIDPETNSLVVAGASGGKPLDREVLSRHSLTILCHDDGIPQMKTFVRLEIDILDCNDFRPRFIDGSGGGSGTDEDGGSAGGGYLETHVPETTAVGSVVLRTIAVDFDRGANGQLRYQLIAGNAGNVFAIDPVFGTVQLVRDLRNSPTREFNLLVKASDGGVPPLSATLTAKVVVVKSTSDDAKGADEEPSFDKNQFACEVSESMEVGSFVFHVRARSQSSLHYEIIAGNYNDGFVISPSTGVIRTLAPLDYEHIKVYNLTISVSNMAKRKAFSSLVVYVIDANDNGPEFDRLDYCGNVTEGSEIGSIVLAGCTGSVGSTAADHRSGGDVSAEHGRALVLQASDPDAETNALKRYEILESEARAFFTVDADTGVIRTRQPIDYERTPRFEFHVRVFDRKIAHLKSDRLAHVVVAVADRNDCVPHFEHKFYNVTVWLPAHKNIRVLAPKASDADSDSLLTYDIIDGNYDNCFRIDSETGELYVEKPEKLRNAKYLLYVRVSDGQFKNITLVQIRVRTPVDTGLKFAKSVYRDSLVENSTKIVRFANLPVLLGSEPNEPIEYRILNPSAWFSIGRSSGVIVTTGRAFDREREPFHALIVEASSAARSGDDGADGADGDEAPRLARTVFNVTVSDVNDNCPMFVNLPYFAVVAVDARNGTQIAKVHAIDLDDSVYGQVRYELKVGRGDLFDVDRVTGAVRLKQPLLDNGGAHNAQFDLTIVAFDGGENRCQSQANVHIKVIDKSVPIFHKQFYSGAISEHSEIGAQLAFAIQADSQLNRKLIYEIVKGNDDEKFSLDFDSASDNNNNGPCILQVIDELDYETRNEYSLVVRAIDSITGVSADVPVSIQIDDYNDCRPEFVKEFYNVSVREALQPFRYSFLQVKAKDNDTGINGKITYAIVKDSEYEPDRFRIDPLSGELTLLTSLDHESQKQHHLRVLATDSGIPNLSGFVHVWINVLDVNDNSPYFLQTNYETEISVLAKRNQFVTILKAIDPDFSDSFNLKYNFVSGNDEHIFEIDSETGIVRLRNLNSFGKTKQFDLQVSVTDGIYTNFTNLTVRLLPENLNSPTFTNFDVNFDIFENQIPAKPLNIEKAFDLDFGKYGEIRYSIFMNKYSDLFAINGTTGAIQLKKKLDREHQSMYTFLVQATDYGDRYSFLTVNIFVRDMNDNRPQFYYEEYTKTIYSDEKINTTLFKIFAYDKDEDKSAKIVYSIYELENVGAQNLFRINPLSGELMLIGNLSDFENKMFQFFVRAEDCGDPVLHSDVPISVLVVSPKEQIPQFNTNLEMFLFEDTPIGTTVAVLRPQNKLSGENSDDADDVGSDGAATAAINYRLVSNSSILSVDRRSGVVKLCCLDRSGSRRLPRIYRAAVVAETDSSPPLAVLIEMTFYVRMEAAALRAHSAEDLLLPRFQYDHYRVRVSELTEPNTPLLKVTASDDDRLRMFDDDDDEDDNDNGDAAIVEYHLMSVDEAMTAAEALTMTKVTEAPADDLAAELFAIDLTTGWLTSIRPLDYELMPNYTFTVLATRNSLETFSRALVTVELTDENDNAIRFTQRAYEADVNENSTRGTVVVRLETSDEDAADESDEQNQPKFDIIFGDLFNQFEVDSSGNVRVREPLDRESIETYQLRVMVRDRRRCFTDEADVLIRVSDANDNPPICSVRRLSKSVYEDIAVDSFLFKVDETYDFDLVESARIAYEIVVPGAYGDSGELLAIQKQFRLNERTGVLRTASAFDREKQSRYRFEVHVIDYELLERKRPRSNCSIEVEIAVLDANDNAPEFTMPYYTVSIAEDAKIGTIVTKVHARDKDRGRNAKITYRLLNENNQFRMLRDNGLIVLASGLDRERQSLYNLSVVAEDGGVPAALQTHVSVLVNVEDVNDNPPEFVQNQYAVVVAETERVDAEILRLRAQSKDIGINAKIEYRIVSGNEHSKFKLDVANGSLSVAGVLDYERVREYFLVVQARDCGWPPLESKVTVNVTITDANDNRPVFNRRAYSATVREDQEIGERILQVFAADADSAANGEVRYAIIGGNKQGKFAIDSRTGYVTVAERLDRELTSFYALEVEARDGGVGETALAASVSVNVEVSDANDNRPEFASANYSLVVRETERVGFALHTFAVSDADVAPNTGPFIFDIRAGNENHCFDIDADGVLRVAAKLDFKRRDRFNLTVRVFDNGSPPLFSDCTVEIRVCEESIHPPIITPLEIQINLNGDADEAENTDSSDDQIEVEYKSAAVVAAAVQSHSRISIGKVWVTDQDPFDKLTYALTNVIGARYSYAKLFDIDAADGRLFANSRKLDAGEYKLNVSVSDGKFVSFSLIKISVEVVTKQCLENAILIRFRQISATKFILSHRKSLMRSIRSVLLAAAATTRSYTDPVLMSVREHEQNASSGAAPYGFLDVLLAVRTNANGATGRGQFLPADRLRKVLNERIAEIESATKLVVEEIVKSSCPNAFCNHRGHCETEMTSAVPSGAADAIETDVMSFVPFAFRQRRSCRCRNGYAGERCTTKINECASEPCPTARNCVPDASPKGYSCQCADGYAGPNCSINLANCSRAASGACYIPRNPISFRRHSFVLYRVQSGPSADLESVFKATASFSVFVRTVQADGVLFFASGSFDYSFLEIASGHVQFRYNLGSGETIIRVSSKKVSDGTWHQVGFERRLNNAVVTVDGTHKAHGRSPGFAEILNTETPRFFVGAELHENVQTAVPPLPAIVVRHGLSGCLDQLKFNDKFLPFHVSDNASADAVLEYFSNVNFNCSETIATEPAYSAASSNAGCASQPCLNGARCLPVSANETSHGVRTRPDYVCECAAKFRGPNCEFYRDPCVSSPCLSGGVCTALEDAPDGESSYRCDCVNNTQGKRCEYGRHCLPNPCQNDAACEEGEHGPICKCNHFRGLLCDVDIDECESSPCQNGATCVNEIGTFHCLCTANFSGVYCNQINKLNAIFDAISRNTNSVRIVIVIVIIVGTLLVISTAFLVCFAARRLKQRRLRKRAEMKNLRSSKTRLLSSAAVASTKTKKSPCVAPKAAVAATTLVTAAAARVKNANDEHLAIAAFDSADDRRLNGVENNRNGDNYVDDDDSAGDSCCNRRRRRPHNHDHHHYNRDHQNRPISKLSNLDVVNYRTAASTMLAATDGCGPEAALAQKSLLLQHQPRPLSYNDPTSAAVAAAAVLSNQNHSNKHQQHQQQQQQQQLLNNLNVLRNYGSAAEDLESLPYHFIRNLMNKQSQPVDLPQPPPFNAQKQQQQQQQQQSMFLNEHVSSLMKDCYKELTKDKLALSASSSLPSPPTPPPPPLLSNAVVCGTLSSKPNNACNVMSPLLSRNSCCDNSEDEDDEKSECDFAKFEPHSPSLSDAQVYHWDCSDWAHRSQNPLPNITEISGGEIIDSSSFQSNEDEDEDDEDDDDGDSDSDSSVRLIQAVAAKPSVTGFQLPGNVAALAAADPHQTRPIDPVRDLDTLNEDIVSDCQSIDSDHNIFENDDDFDVRNYCYKTIAGHDYNKSRLTLSYCDLNDMDNVSDEPDNESGRKEARTLTELVADANLLESNPSNVQQTAV